MFATILSPIVNFAQSIFKNKSYKSMLYAIAILYTSIPPVYAATAIYPHTDADLLAHGNNKKFQDVIQITIRTNDKDYDNICSAAKVILPGITIPLYITAAHCFEDAVEAWDSKQRRISDYMLNPVYALNPIADLAFFTIPQAPVSGGYPLYMGEVKLALAPSLVSVGYQESEAARAYRQRRAFYTGEVRNNDFSISQQLETPTDKKTSLRTGTATQGESGGPLLRQGADSKYEIVGISTYSIPGELTTWSTIDTAVIAAAVKVFAQTQRTFINRTEDAKRYMQQAMLADTGQTWDELRESLHSNAVVQEKLGVWYAMRQQYVKAVQWFKKSAEQGYPPAQHALGIRYSTGTGVAANGSEAFKWHLKAAKQGFAKAQNSVAAMYREGKYVTQSDTEAFKWCQQAANAGIANAQYNLALHYYNGLGVQRNLKQATEWLTLLGGDARAKELLTVIAPHLEDL